MTTGENEEAASWSALWIGQRGIGLIIICAGVLSHSMSALLMSTVMPAAVRDIGGLEYMAWPTTAFLAASVVSASAGSVARAYLGARTGFAIAALVFGLGAFVSSIAPSIGFLVVGRLIQGLGGGVIAALAYIMVRTIYPEPLWPRVFALLSGIWGISALGGPFIGGVFADLGFWRGAFLFILSISIALAGLSLWKLPPDREKRTPSRFPALRLSLISLGIILLSLAAPLDNWIIQTSLIFSAFAVLSSSLYLDRRGTTPLLPSDAFSIATPVGLGIWVIFLISLANDPFPIYGPLFLQTLHGMSALTAGYLVAMEALSWTIVAAIVASLPARWSPFFILTGPLTMGLGLIGISAFLAEGNMILLVLSVLLAGGGIGACFTFLSQTIMAAAKPGEEDSAASSIPTVQLVGLATGAAIAGLIANVTGFSAGLSAETAQSASYWVPGAFAIAAVLGALASYGLNRLRHSSPDPNLVH